MKTNTVIKTDNQNTKKYHSQQQNMKKKLTKERNFEIWRKYIT